MADSNTCLRHEDYIDADTYTNSAACTTVPANSKILAGDPNGIATNVWGFSLNDGISYIAPQPAGSTTPIKTTSAATSSDNTVVTFGAKVNSALYHGEYSGQLVMTAVANMPAAPTITNVCNPANSTCNPATAAAGTQIVLTGTNFTTAYQVTIDGTNCTSASIDSDTQITCTVPADSNNTQGTPVDVVVSTWGGTVTSMGGFAYPPPAQNFSQSCQPDSFSTSGQILPTTAQGIVVDIDPNMIPVKYTGDNTAPEWQTTTTDNTGNAWYSYDTTSKQWANAITVRSANLAPYKNTDGIVVNPSHVLGYWVYIPRYRYQVMRCNASDPNITPRPFAIRFENKNGVGYNTAIPAQNGDWATHPAFTLGETELNGVWIGKYETNSTTIRPNVSTAIMTGNILSKWNTAQSIQSSHNVSYDTRMARNADWGAMAYLASSEYGTGISTSATEPGASDSSNPGAADGGIRINSNSYRYTTGCGPINDAGSTTTYVGGVALGGTCMSDGVDKSYYTDLGILSSTTKNVYGIYGLSGGADEFVLANYNGATGYSGLTSDGNGGFTQIASKYIDFYTVTSPIQCTFVMCGGHALHETANWNGDANYPLSATTPWFLRGYDYSRGSLTGVFAHTFYSAGTSGMYRPVMSDF
jgi:hypothetical protein